MKKVFKVFFVIAIVAIGGVNLYNSHRTVTISDVTMANIEALAGDSEDSKGCKLSLLRICETANSDHYLYRNV